MGKKKKSMLRKAIDFEIIRFSVHIIYLCCHFYVEEITTKKERKKERKDSMIVNFLIVHIYQSIIFEKERINNDKVAAKSY